MKATILFLHNVRNNTEHDVTIIHETSQKDGH
jgi:hypothetical protein